MTLRNVFSLLWNSFKRLSGISAGKKALDEVGTMQTIERRDDA